MVKAWIVIVALCVLAGGRGYAADDTVCQTDDAGGRVSCGEGQAALIRLNDDAAAAVGPQSEVLRGETLTLIKGRVHLESVAPLDLAVGLDAVPLQLTGCAVAEITSDRARLCLKVDSRATAGETVFDADAPLALRWQNGSWEIDSQTDLCGWSPAAALLVGPLAPLAFDKPAENVATGEKTGGLSGGSDTEERGGGGEAICLDSAGGSGGAVDAIDNPPDVAGEHGQARVTVRVKLRD